MNRTIRLALALVVSATLSACAAEPRASDQTTPSGAVGTSGTTLNADQAFVDSMLSDGVAEIELGRMAKERSSNPAVRDFADTMIRDHSKAGDELKQIARGAGSPSEAMLDSAHRDLQDRLAKLSGADFDREYIQAMVDGHEKAVRAVEETSQAAENTDVRQWAERTLPTIKQHLERAKQLQESLGK